MFVVSSLSLWLGNGVKKWRRFGRESLRPGWLPALQLPCCGNTKPGDFDSYQKEFYYGFGCWWRGVKTEPLVVQVSYIKVPTHGLEVSRMVQAPLRQ